MTRLYLIRHAQAEGNLYRRMHGWYDSRITEMGRRQIEALTERFANIPVDVVYSSPLRRCTETAQAVCGPQHLPLRIEQGLIEIGIGVWEDLPFGEVQRRDPERLRLFGEVSPEYEVEGGETYLQCQERMLRALRKIAAENTGKTVACFSHGMVIRLALAAFHGYDLEGIRKVPHSDNTGVACVEVEDDGQVRVLMEADNSHLPPELSTAIRKKTPGQERAAFALGDSNLWFRPWQPEAERALYDEYRHEAWIDIHGPKEPFDAQPFYQAALRASRRDSNAVMVACLGEETVGMLQIDLDRDAAQGICFVPFVYMNPTYRHRGLGVQLIGQAIATARPLGRRCLRLRCSPTNDVAQRFYARNGFVKVGMAADSRVPLELLEKEIR